MKVVEISEPGEPDVLSLVQRQKPQVADNEVLIKVAAAGVNRPDVAQRKGVYPPPPGASDIPGLEVAGEICQLGKEVVDWQVGDRVCALTNGGGYAEYVNVPQGHCLPVPTAWSMIEAAGLPETCFTVWANVFATAKLTAGETFLVHGGTSGIGVTAIQMAKAMGTCVFATAGSDEKCQTCERLGADLAINYRQQDFVSVIKQATSDKGVDVILDMVGGDYVSKNLSLAALDGRVVNIAFQNGFKTEVNLLPILTKRVILTGSTLRPQSDHNKARIARQLRTSIWPLIEDGKIKPVIHKVYPLDKVVQAHQLMESGLHSGKIIIQISD